MNQPPAQLQVGIAKIYVKDLSFESPQAPLIFQKNWRPEIKIDAQIQHRMIQESLYEVVLLLTIEAHEGQSVGFIVEIEQAGLFEIAGASDQQKQHILNVFCPGTLFPYARQAVDQALNLGGFPPLMLAPVDFEGLSRGAPSA
jgi:preprotein translocase subunit SecB